MSQTSKNKLVVMPKRTLVPSVDINFMNTDTVEDLSGVEAIWFEAYGVNPESAINQYEADLVRTAARADWLSKRADRTYAEVEARIYALVPDPMMWDETQHRTIRRFLHYRTKHAQAVTRHRKALEEYRLNRTAEFEQIQNLHLAMGKLDPRE